MYCFSVFHCFYFSKSVVFSEKKLFLLTAGIPIGIPSANILLSVWEIKGAGVPLSYIGTGKP